jgi:hypothetical protein
MPLCFQKDCRVVYIRIGPDIESCDKNGDQGLSGGIRRLKRAEAEVETNTPGRDKCYL